MTSTNGVWLHGVVADSDPLSLNGMTGMDGGPLWTVSAAGLSAVVSTAPPAEFGEEALRRNLEDLDWLSRTAWVHHQVVAALAATGPVVPARLATVYHDEDRVAAMLSESREELARALDRVAGHVEWGVKGYAAQAQEANPAPANSGTAYLARRKAQLTSRDQSKQAALRDAAMVHETLSTRASAVRRHRPQDRKLSGADTDMVLNGAYLIKAARVSEFAALVEQLSARHLAVRLALTGPWPPYSFTDGPEQEGPEQEGPEQEGPEQEGPDKEGPDQ